MATNTSTTFTMSRRRLYGLIGLAAFIGSCMTVHSAHAQLAGQRREYPSADYYVGLELLEAGEFLGAGRAFRSAARSGVRSSEGRWVDSICYHTMLGECLYQMGDLGSALDEYTNALNLFIAHRNWMLRVEFPPTLDVANVTGRDRPTWGASQRRAVPARFPNSYQILQGRLDNEQVIRQGGVVALPEFYLINAHEVMRCTAQAIRRRSEIMGRAAPHDPLTTQLVAALQTRPAPPNHWSVAWVNSLLGLAYASSGRPEEAKTELGNSLVIASQFDHPLTATSLFGLGKIAFEQEQYGTASGLFLEASLSAAWFGQYALVEESLRWGANCHIVSGQAGMYAPLDPAAVWARRESDLMYASVTVSAAEVAANAGNTAVAATLLEQARRSMVRADMRQGHVGARHQYVQALNSFATGNVRAGETAFKTLMAYQQNSSQKLFELGLIDRLVTSGVVSERVGIQLYDYALGEPGAKDWNIDPVETLSMVLTPHLAPMEHWFELSLKNNKDEKAIEISDRIRRHRFYTTLPMGGRLVALRWVLEAPPEAVSKRAFLQRQDLLARYPKYAALSKQSAALRKQIEELPLVPEDDEAQQTQKRLMGQLAQIGTAQEVILRELALRRVPADFVFPPALDYKAFKAKLPKKALVVSFLVTSRTIHVCSFGKENYKLGTLDGGATLRKGIGAMLRAMGNYDKNQPVDLDVLTSGDWKESARAMFKAIMVNRKASDFDEIDELVIVPDGALWYLPFEALHVGDEDDSIPLIAKTRIRYSPTIALAGHDGRAPPTTGAETGAVVGALFPRDDEQVGLAAFAELKASLPEVTSFKEPLAVPSKMIAPVCDRLVVLTDIQREGSGPYGWSPMQLDQGKAGSTVSDWAMLPFGSPDQIILPGFHTEAETALKRAAGGEDVFLGLCGLMASGSRTILLSRWRTGGKSSYDLTREFVQELPYTTPTRAWQRSVFLGMSSELDLTQEPRVKNGNMDRSVQADHPFFWSSYLLVTPGEAITTATDKKKEDAVAKKE